MQAQLAETEVLPLSLLKVRIASLGYVSLVYRLG